MPDITMCNDEDCAKRLTCRRFIAEPTPGRQSYFMSSPREGDVCDHYYPWRIG